MVKRYGCCGVPWSIATILLLSSSIISNTSGVLFSSMYRDHSLQKFFFDNEIEQSMTYIFVLVEVVVFFSAILSAFKKKTSMLTFATVMLLLESYFITLAAVRVYHRNGLQSFWQDHFKPHITNSTIEPLKDFFKINQESVPMELVIVCCSIVTVILILKICTAMVVNSYKNYTEMVRAENMFYRFKTGREKPQSRPTSYVYSTMPISDKHMYE